MKRQILQITTIAVALFMSGLAWGQSSGDFWIKTFSPGSSDLNDPMIDVPALAHLDSLMKDVTIQVTFLGAADSLGWRLDGKHVHAHVSEAWNDAKRLSRARALRARYGRGTVRVTHESIAGVKVMWTRPESHPTSHTLNELKEQNENLDRELAKLRDEFENSKSDPRANGTDEHIEYTTEIRRETLTFNWRLQAGIWTWHSSSGGSLVSPSIGLNIIIGKTAFVFQGGVTPWHSSSALGNKSESFVHMGIKYFKTERVGFTIGGFRGWEFLTDTDDWSFKTTGLATGVFIRYGAFEINPTLTVSNVNTLEQDSQWRLGSVLGLNYNIN